MGVVASRQMVSDSKRVEPDSQTSAVSHVDPGADSTHEDETVGSDVGQRELTVRARLYASMKVRAAPSTELAEELRSLLAGAAQVGDIRGGGDGMHLSPLGMHLAVPIVQGLADAFSADCLASDSTLCTVDPETKWADKNGLIAQAGITVPVVPWWGASFGSWAFGRAAQAAWRKVRHATRIVLIVAGNDLMRPTAAHVESVVEEMDSLKTWWAEWGVDLIYIDVVPPEYQQ